MNVIIPLMYISISIAFFYKTQRISLLKNFVVSDEKEIRLRYLMYLDLVLGSFELYIGICAIFYYAFSLSQDEILYYLSPAAVIFLYLVSSVILRMTTGNKERLPYDIIALPLALTSSIFMVLASDIFLTKALLLLFILVTSIMIFIPFSRDIFQQVKSIRENDPVEKARGIGAFLTILGGISSSLFFLINRAIGTLFGLYAILAQLSLLLTAYGLYVSLAPPDYLIKITARGELR